MVKRIVTKIGDIFCVAVNDAHKCYFQYIANDLTLLNSSTIRVFKRHYPIDYNPDFNEIVKDEVSFYSHTVLSVGIRFGYWEKVGKSRDVGDINKAIFRIFEEIEFKNLSKSVRWSVWKINQPMVFIGGLTEDYQTAEVGMVFPCTEIVHKIRTGDYKTKFPE